MKGPESYFSAAGEWFEPHSDKAGWDVVEVLPELRGCPWGDVALGYVAGMRPTMVRVIPKSAWLASNACNGRVTVYLGADGRIERVEQEVSVLGGSGAQMRQRMDEAKKMPASGEVVR